MAEKIDILISEIILALSCIVCERMIYISTPITGGFLLLRSEHDDAIMINKNITSANLFARQVMKETKCPVINPAQFMMVGWSQHDYITLWEKVISTIASEIWFNDGWEYSNGCAQEYIITLQKGIPARNSHGDLLSPFEAEIKLRQAMHELTEHGRDAAFISSALTYVVQYCAKK